MKKIFYIFLLIAALSACSSMNWWGGWGNFVTVRKGDTLYSISRKYNVPIKDLINTNRLAAPYTLYVGQKINLPAKQYHTVQRGESLYSISRIYNVDVTSLSRVNNLKTPYSLSVGQKLLLPASVSASATGKKAGTAQSAVAKAPQKNVSSAASQMKATYLQRPRHLAEFQPQNKVFMAGKRYGYFGIRQFRQRAEKRRHKH